MTPPTDRLDALLGTELIATGDLILADVLQGFTRERDFNQARKLLPSLLVVGLAGQEIAIQAARNFRALRARRLHPRQHRRQGQRLRLAEHVFPRLPVRQWVLSVPKRLRYFLQAMVLPVLHGRVRFRVRFSRAILV